MFQKYFCNIKYVCFRNYISTVLLLLPLGSNIFIHPHYDNDIFVIDDSSFEKLYGISIDISRYWPTEFELSETISIKELFLYNFRKEEPFTRITNSIFSMVNYTSRGTKKKYYLKVSWINNCPQVWTTTIHIKEKNYWDFSSMKLIVLNVFFRTFVNKITLRKSDWSLLLIWTVYKSINRAFYIVCIEKQFFSNISFFCYYRAIIIHFSQYYCIREKFNKNQTWSRHYVFLRPITWCSPDTVMQNFKLGQFIIP